MYGQVKFVTAERIAIKVLLEEKKKKKLKYSNDLYQERHQYGINNPNPCIHVQHTFSRKMFQTSQFIICNIAPV